MKSRHHHHRDKEHASPSALKWITLKKSHATSSSSSSWFSLLTPGSIRWLVLVALCLQNTLSTVFRRYSLGVLHETYSRYEFLLVGELIKLTFSSYMISKSLLLPTTASATEELHGNNSSRSRLSRHFFFLARTSKKMVVLAGIYGLINILGLMALKNIGAGMYTVFCQCKILSTACFSSLILRRRYTWSQWRALGALSAGVLLFSEPIWGGSDILKQDSDEANPYLGTAAVLAEVALSGFASIYFEKVIKTDDSALQLSIWERNWQLAAGSLPVYLGFIFTSSSDQGFGAGWSWFALFASSVAAAGGLLVALSIKYGDSILKTLATTGAIVFSSILDHVVLGGPLTPVMMLAGSQVILSICNYTFDTTPKMTPSSSSSSSSTTCLPLPLTKLSSSSTWPLPGWTLNVILGFVIIAGTLGATDMYVW